MGHIDKEVAEKAIAALMPSMSTPDGSGENDHLVLAAQEMCVDAMETIHEFPEVDVVPVVHGKWVVGGVHGNGVIGNWKCDICKGVSLKKTLYCPYCGAKMDLEDK